MPDVPVVLRHRDSRSQAWMFGAFAAVLLAIPGAAFVTSSSARWWLLVLVAIAIFPAYACVRLATLRVVLDEHGVNEPAPFRPTIVTPWADVVRVRRTEDPGAMRLTFLGVSIEHKGGWRHQVMALNMNDRDPTAGPTIAAWIEEIREAKKRYTAAR